MWRISAEVYEQALDAGELTAGPIAVQESVTKAWDVLARILADGRVPMPVAGAARAVAGGEMLPGEDADYGGTRVLSGALVADVHAELAAISDEDVEHRYRTVDFTDCYGTEAHGVHASPVEAYLNAFHVVRDFYAEAAEHGDAMAVWLG
jgi:hypothetical protein